MTFTAQSDWSTLVPFARAFKPRRGFGDAPNTGRSLWTSFLRYCRTVFSGNRKTSVSIHCHASGSGCQRLSAIRRQVTGLRILYENVWTRTQTTDWSSRNVDGRPFCCLIERQFTIGAIDNHIYRLGEFSSRFTDVPAPWISHPESLRS